MPNVILTTVPSGAAAEEAPTWSPVVAVSEQDETFVCRDGRVLPLKGYVDYLLSSDAGVSTAPYELPSSLGELDLDALQASWPVL